MKTNFKYSAFQDMHHEQVTPVLNDAAQQYGENVSCNEGDIYATLGDEENLHRALELYQKDFERLQALAREQGTPQSRQDLAVSYYRVGDIYMTLEGAENQRRALELHQKSLELREDLTRCLGTPQSHQDLAVSYNKVGDVYTALGGEENLCRALEMYQKELEISETLVREQDTISAYDALAVSCCNLGTHPSIEPDERQNYLERFLELSEMLYRQTQSERHRCFVADAQKLLAEVEQV